MAGYAYVVASNTRAGIQTEIDKAHAEGGGLVFLPRGTYALDGPLRLRSNVHLTGVGHRTVLHVDPALGPAAAEVNVIELDGGDEDAPHDVEISKLVIRGPSQRPDITEGASSDFRKGCGIVAVQTAVRHVVVQACRIEHVGGCGILFATQSDRHLVEDVTIRDCSLLQNRRPDASGTPSNYKDIFFYGARFENVRVEGNVCSFAPTASSTYGNDSGIAFVGNGHSGYARHTRLVGNVCAGHRRHGLLTNYGTLVADGVFVADNRCEDNGWVGVYVNAEGTVAGSGHLVVSGNFCAHNGSGGVSETGRPDATIRGGIILNAAHHGVVSGNVCTDNGEPGDVFKAHGRLADADAVHAAGIRVRGTEHLVDANLVKGNRGDGIVLWPAPVSRVSITSNRAVQNGKNGIFVSGAPDEAARQVIVTGNVCAGNGEHGIRSVLTDGALVAANYICDNAKAGIAIARTARHVEIEGNYIDARAGQRAVQDDSVKTW